MNQKIKEIISSLDESRRDQVLKMFTEQEKRFEEAPAATRSHGSWKGGLCDHTIEVCKVAVALFFADIDKVWETMTLESVIFCALVHDFGKIGTNDNPMYLFTEDKIKYNTNIPSVVNHETLSLKWLRRYEVKMTPEEEFAIEYHAGPYNTLKPKETPLQILLHSADNFCTKVYGI